MKRERNRLTPVGMKALKKPGRYADGGGLYLLVRPDGRRTRVFRWRDRITGKLRDKGLGIAGDQDVGLAEAREPASACRRILRDGGDPIADPRRERLALQLERARRKTFGECADAYIAAHAAEWRNQKHKAWEASLSTCAAPLLPLPVAEIDTAMVVNVLEPIWTSKTETATRTRQRIEAVLGWAAARKLRPGRQPGALAGLAVTVYGIGRIARTANLVARAEAARAAAQQRGEALDTANEARAEAACEVATITIAKAVELLGDGMKPHQLAADIAPWLGAKKQTKRSAKQVRTILQNAGYVPRWTKKGKRP